MTFFDYSARNKTISAVIPLAIAALLAGCESIDSVGSSKQAASEIVAKGNEDDQFLTLYPGMYTGPRARTG